MTSEYKPGDKIGIYEILEGLGSGGFGAVYVARHSILERRVAIKIVHRALATNDALAKLMYREAKIVAGLHHPNIVTLHDAGEQDGAVYLVMDYIEGPPLGVLMETFGPSSLLVLLRIMARVAGALQHAHQRGVIHKDVKPFNIVVAHSGEPVLVDFGLSVSAGDSLQPPVTWGTPAFMSPEQAEKAAITDRTDIWGVGATLFRLISGRPLYVSEDHKAVIDMLRSPDPVDLSSLKDRAPQYVVDIIGRCLKKDPKARYQSAEDLQRALEAAIDHLELSESDTIVVSPPKLGQTLLLHVEYQEADLHGAFREYEIGPHVGAGTYGDVYRAVEKLSGKNVALKVLKREWVTSQDAVTRFRREAALLSRLTHPNIVKVHNFGRYGPTFFMAMDFIAGDNLQAIIKRRGRMDARQALFYVVPILIGLGAVHDAGIVHRDLKPANVAVAESEVIICDFGMASSQGMQKLTVTGMFLGSPSYASPEQAAGDQPGTASDVYAAAAILYELLSGRLPHEADSPFKVIQKVMSVPPTPIADYCPGLPVALTEMLERMLAKEPSTRPSALEAAAALRSLM